MWPWWQGTLLHRFRRGGRCRTSPGNTQFDPGGQLGQFIIGQLAGGGHLHVAFVPHGMDQRAFVRLARHDHDRGIASFEQRLARVEPQAGLLLVGSVTLQAARREHRTDFGLEEALGIGGARSCRDHRDHGFLTRAAQRSLTPARRAQR